MGYDGRVREGTSWNVAFWDGAQVVWPVDAEQLVVGLHRFWFLNSATLDGGNSRRRCSSRSFFRCPLLNFGAALLVLFLVPVTFTMHRFWGLADPAATQLQMILFMKNLGLVGAALLTWIAGVRSSQLVAQGRLADALDHVEHFGANERIGEPGDITTISVERFLDSGVRDLGSKLGPILWQLPDDLPARSAQRGADRDLPPSGAGTGEQEVRDVAAGDEQHGEGDRAENQRHGAQSRRMHRPGDPA